MKKRMDWIDIAKALCIITVVLFHINFESNYSSLNDIWNYLGKLAGIFEVSLFYCVAGLTLNNDKIKNTKLFLIDKFKKLYLKVIPIGLVAVIFHNLFIKIGFYKIGVEYAGKIMVQYGKVDYVKNIFYTLLLGNREVVLGAMWFVYTLIIAFVLLALLQFVLDRINIINNKRLFRLIITFVLMNISILLTNVFSITVPRFSNTLVGIFLIDSTNYLFVEKKLNFDNLYIFLVCFLLAVTSGIAGTMGINGNVIPNPLFLIVYVFAFEYVIFFVSKMIEKSILSKTLSYIGKKTFSIMAFHFIGFKLGTLLLRLFGGSNDLSVLTPNANNMALVLYYLIFGLFVSIVMSFILKKVFKYEL